MCFEGKNNNVAIIVMETMIHIQRSCNFGRAFAKQIEQVNTGPKVANCDVTSQCLGKLEKHSDRALMKAARMKNNKTAAF